MSYDGFYRILEDGNSNPYVLTTWRWPLQGKPIVIKTMARPSL